MIDIQLTPNFKLSEFVLSDTANKSEKLKAKQEFIRYDIFTNILAVARKLQIIRDDLRLPIYINSGYRCTQLNFAVKGAPLSAHLLGLAVDITTNSFFDNDALFKLCKLVDFDQLICYGNPIRFIHLGFSYQFRNPRKEILQKP